MYHRTDRNCRSFLPRTICLVGGYMKSVDVLFPPEITSIVCAYFEIVPPIGNLSTFLGDKKLLRAFLKFVKKKKTEDFKLLEFYLMAGQFKTYGQDPNSTRAAQRSNAKLIIETFFLPDSKKFLEQVQGMTRHSAMSQWLSAGKNTDLEPTLFDTATHEIKAELISRVFPIYMQSDRYTRLVKEGKVRRP